MKKWLNEMITLEGKRWRWLWEIIVIFIGLHTIYKWIIKVDAKIINYTIDHMNEIIYECKNVKLKVIRFFKRITRK